MPCDPPVLASLDPGETIPLTHYWVVDDLRYHQRWVEKSIGCLMPAITHVRNHNEIGVASTEWRCRPRCPPPNILSQSYDVLSYAQPMTQIPQVKWSFPMHIDGHLKN
ncbi:hypothetical protein MKX01_038944, partial [Papaver californicum]